MAQTFIAEASCDYKTKYISCIAAAYNFIADVCQFFLCVCVGDVDVEPEENDEAVEDRMEE